MGDMDFMNNTITTTHVIPHMTNMSTERIDVIENPDSIEMIYKETHTPMMWPNNGPFYRVYKIVFSCQDGKWNKSEPIYGKIIPAQNESYDFEE